MSPGTTQNTISRMGGCYRRSIYRGSRGGTFMCCMSCWEVTCVIPRVSGCHSYKVIWDEPPTTNLFSPRGCQSRRLSEEATI